MIVYRGKIGVAPIEENIMENQLRWFGHAQRKPQEVPMRRVDCRVFSPMKRRRERLRTLEKVVKRDFVVNNIAETLVF